ASRLISRPATPTTRRNRDGFFKSFSLSAFLHVVGSCLGRSRLSHLYPVSVQPLRETSGHQLPGRACSNSAASPLNGFSESDLLPEYQRIVGGWSTKPRTVGCENLRIRASTIRVRANGARSDCAYQQCV